MVEVHVGVNQSLVVEGNCVTVRWGGEQLEVNCQSVTLVNSIRPSVVASLPSSGEAQMTLLSRLRDGSGANRSRGKPCASKHTIAQGRQGVVGDGMAGRFNSVKQGDLNDFQASQAGRSGVRAFVVARKSVNADGAKGRRKMDASWPSPGNPNRRECLWLNKPERRTPYGVAPNRVSGPFAC